MGDSDLREHEGRTGRAGGPVFDLTASKLRRPLVRHGTVRRSPLVERLAHGDRRPIVSVVAPPGYGKTTVLAQWAERNGQSFAWVSVDERDNDPKVLLTYVAQALDAVEPIDERVFDALASPGSSVPGSGGSRLALAGRSRPPLRVARLRAEILLRRVREGHQHFHRHTGGLRTTSLTPTASRRPPPGFGQPEVILSERILQFPAEHHTEPDYEVAD